MIKMISCVITEYLLKYDCIICRIIRIIINYAVLMILLVNYLKSEKTMKYFTLFLAY